MPENKKKLLILIDWFVPGYKAGGPIRSCVNMAIALKERFDIYVLTTDTDHGEVQPYNNIRVNEWTTDELLGPDIHIYYLKKKQLSIKQVKAQIDFVVPDIIYLNHVFSPYFTIYPLWLKYNHTIAGKMILCPRGTLLKSSLSVKTYKKKPFLLLLKWLGICNEVIFHVNNAMEKEGVLAHFPKSNIIVADNIADTQQPFCSTPKTPGTLKCIFVSRIAPLKNLLFFLNILEQVKARIQFTIVGPLVDEAYWQQCQQQIARLPVNIKVDMVGPKPHNELASIIQQSHLFVFPTKGENYGHVIVEALLAGRPVLISDQTPWLNLAMENAGWDIPLKDTDGYISIVERVAAWNQEDFDMAALSAWQFAKHTIETSTIQQQYLELFA